MKNYRKTIGNKHQKEYVCDGVLINGLIIVISFSTVEINEIGLIGI